MVFDTETNPRIVRLNDAGVAFLAQRVTPGTASSSCVVIGVAGIGGSGKSTVAKRLAENVSGDLRGAVRIVPMDGFHLPNAELDRRGLRDVKGSPATFNADAFIGLLRRVRQGEHMTRPVAFPVYDRTLHEPVITGRPEHTIDPSTRIVLTEGNYLLLDEPPWSALAQVLDECWFIDTPLDAAKRRIIARHVRGGRDEADALAHYERTDLPNARLILANRRTPDLILRWPDDNE